MGQLFSLFFLIFSSLNSFNLTNWSLIRSYIRNNGTGKLKTRVLILKNHFCFCFKNIKIPPIGCHRFSKTNKVALRKLDSNRLITFKTVLQHGLKCPLGYTFVYIYIYIYIYIYRLQLTV
jgi:hypothetical protein